MAKGAKIVLTGDAQLRRNMARLAKLYDGRTMDEDLEFAAEPLRREAENNARPLRNYVGKYPDFFPQPTKAPIGGHLDEGVEARRVDAKGNKRREWWVAFSKRARKLAHLVEFGTAPHFQKNFRGGWMHPGARPRPFFRPAFDAKKNTVLDRIVSRARARLLTAASRMKRR